MAVAALVVVPALRLVVLAPMDKHDKHHKHHKKDKHHKHDKHDKHDKHHKRDKERMKELETDEEKRARRLASERAPYGLLMGGKTEAAMLARIREYRRNTSVPLRCHYATCAVVGSSGSLRGGALGATIDAHDANSNGQRTIFTLGPRPRSRRRDPSRPQVRSGTRTAPASCTPTSSPRT